MNDVNLTGSKRPLDDTPAQYQQQHRNPQVGENGEAQQMAITPAPAPAPAAVYTMAVIRWTEISITPMTTPISVLPAVAPRAW